ncbi:MAG: hypothetical protein N3D14_01275 [Aquificaceae bacterium]|nr:hypothetical protein [Aquificaceae bacterium]MCX8164009.1 hypothetical protein [Aquificaceae bacterium]
MLKANTEDYIRELKLLAHHIEEQHGHVLKNLQEPLLLTVELNLASKAHFLISSEGINYLSEPLAIRDQIRVSYKDLLRLVEKPSRILRYILEGRVVISGNYQRVLSTLQKLF